MTAPIRWTPRAYRLAAALRTPIRCTLGLALIVALDVAAQILWPIRDAGAATVGTAPRGDGWIAAACGIFLAVGIATALAWALTVRAARDRQVR